VAFASHHLVVDSSGCCEGMGKLPMNLESQVYPFFFLHPSRAYPEVYLEAVGARHVFVSNAVLPE
jgi:hypothetical protein